MLQTGTGRIGHMLEKLPDAELDKVRQWLQANGTTYEQRFVASEISAIQRQRQQKTPIVPPVVQPGAPGKPAEIRPEAQALIDDSQADRKNLGLDDLDFGVVKEAPVRYRVTRSLRAAVAELPESLVGPAAVTRHLEELNRLQSKARAKGLAALSDLELTRLGYRLGTRLSAAASVNSPQLPQLQAEMEKLEVEWDRRNQAEPERQMGLVRETPGQYAAFNPRDWETVAKVIAGYIAEKNIGQPQMEAALKKKYGDGVAPYLLKIWNRAVQLAQKANLDAKSDQTGELFPEGVDIRGGDQPSPQTIPAQPPPGRPQPTAGGAVGGRSVRPPIRIADADQLPKPVEIITAEAFEGWPDEHQRLAINLALQARANGERGMVEADGVGVGKSGIILGILDWIRDEEPSKPVLLVVPNKLKRQIEAGLGSYVTAAKAMGVNLKRFEIGSYEDLRSGKIGKRDYAIAVWDEAHNLKGLETQQTKAARAVKAAFRIYATATPADTPIAFAYFVGDAIGESTESVMNRIGVELRPLTKPNGQPILDRHGNPEIRAFPIQGLSWQDVKRNMIGERNKMIAKGTMIRREYPFFGTITEHGLLMDSEQKRIYDLAKRAYDRYVDKAIGRFQKMNRSGVRTQGLARLTESNKIDRALRFIGEALQEQGGTTKVVVVAEGVNPPKIWGLEGEAPPPGFFETLSAKLRERGVAYAQIYGDVPTAQEIEKFQSDANVRVALMNTKSGGAGVDLDDIKGDAPRIVGVFTMNFSGDAIDQLHGRFSRRNTASPVEIRYFIMADSFGDQRRAEVAHRKLEALRLVQRGADPDVARPLFDEQGGLVMERREPYSPAIEQIGVERVLAGLEAARQKYRTELPPMTDQESMVALRKAGIRADGRIFQDPDTDEWVVEDLETGQELARTKSEATARVAALAKAKELGLDRLSRRSDKPPDAYYYQDADTGEWVVVDRATGQEVARQVQKGNLFANALANIQRLQPELPLGLVRERGPGKIGKPKQQELLSYAESGFALEREVDTVTRQAEEAKEKEKTQREAEELQKKQQLDLFGEAPAGYLSGRARAYADALAAARATQQPVDSQGLPTRDAEGEVSAAVREIVREVAQAEFALTIAPPTAQAGALVPGREFSAVRIADIIEGDGSILGLTIRSLHDAAAISRRFRDPRFETVRAYLLDDNNRVVGHYAGRGLVDGAVADIEAIARYAKQLGATRLWLAHNHPSGDPTPSGQDRRLTQDFRRAFALGKYVRKDGVTVALATKLDVQGHVVINGHQYAEIYHTGDVYRYDWPATLRRESWELVPLESLSRVTDGADAAAYSQALAAERQPKLAVLYLSIGNTVLGYEDFPLAGFEELTADRARWLADKTRRIGAKNYILVTNFSVLDNGGNIAKGLRLFTDAVTAEASRLNHPLALLDVVKVGPSPAASRSYRGLAPAEMFREPSVQYPATSKLFKEAPADYGIAGSGGLVAEGKEPYGKEEIDRSAALARRANEARVLQAAAAARQIPPPIAGARGIPAQREVTEQAQALSRHAAANGLVLPTDFFDAMRRINIETMERDVFTREPDKRVFKRTRPTGDHPYGASWTVKYMGSGATPEMYLRRLVWMNRIFKTDVRFEGITAGQKPAIITSEPWIEAANEQSPHPTREQLHALMRQLDFSPLATTINGWTRPDGVNVYDVRPANFIQTAEGPVPIDLVIEAPGILLESIEPPPGLVREEAPEYAATKEPEEIAEITRAGGARLPVRFGGLQYVQPIPMPELFELAQQAGAKVTTNPRLRSALGRFVGVQGVEGGRVELAPATAQNPALLARVFAHEVGHLADFLDDLMLARGNLIGRLLSMTGRYLRDAFPPGYLNTPTNKALREELIALTQWWKPWTEAESPSSYNTYRKSAKELYADFLSVLLNAPAEAAHRAPQFYKAFFGTLDKKPSVARQFSRLQLILTDPQVLGAHRFANIPPMFQRAEDEARRLHLLAKADEKLHSTSFHARMALVDKNSAALDARKRMIETGRIEPRTEGDPRYALEENDTVTVNIQSYLRELDPLRRQIKEHPGTLSAGGKTFRHQDVVSAILYLERIAAGDRWEYANPLGHIPGTAGQELRWLENNYQGWADARRHVDQFHDWFAQVNELMFEDMMTPEQIQRVKAGAGTYATFRVTKYMREWVSAGVIHQKGTFEDIGDPMTATILKAVSMIRAARRNQFKKEVATQLLQNADLFNTPIPGYPSEPSVVEAKVTLLPDAAGNHTIPHVAASRNPHLAPIMWKEKGKWRAAYVDKYIAASFTHDSSMALANAASVSRLLLNNTVWRPLLIAFSPAFQVRNLPRDTQRTYKALVGPGRHTAVELLRAYASAIGPARARAKGVYDPLIVEMERNQALNVTLSELMRTEGREESEVEVLFHRYGMDIEHLRPDWQKSPLGKAIMAFADWVFYAGNVIESLPKIAGYTLLDDLDPRERARWVRTYIGTPNPKRRGTSYIFSNNLILFSNVNKEGWRSDFGEMAVQPSTAAGWWWRTIKLGIVPRLLFRLALFGVFGAWMAQWARRQDRYNRRSHVLLPLGETDSGKAVTLRIPNDEATRVVSGLFDIALDAATGEYATGGRAASQAFDFGLDQVPFLGGAHPMLTIAGAWKDYAEGQMPRDSFRATDILTEDELKAGGIEAMMPLAKWTLNRTGLLKLDLHDRFRDQPLWEKTARVAPGLNALLLVTNMGEYEQLREQIIKTQAQEAGERLALGKRIKAGVAAGTEPIEFAFAETPESRAELGRLTKQFGRAQARSSEDVVTRALLGTTSNAQKVAVLQVARSRFASPAKFDDYLFDLLGQGIISKEVYLMMPTAAPAPQPTSDVIDRYLSR